MNKFKPKIGIIITARTDSKRLPNKVLFKIRNLTLLEFMVNRLKKIKGINKIIIATTKKKNDDKIVSLFNQKKKIKIFRGSEENVIKRVLDSAKKNSIDIIISLTGDCPLVDVQLIGQMLKIFMKNPQLDFLTNAHLRTYPDGMDIQILKYKSLKKSYSLAKTKRDFEHTTLSIRKNLKKFNYLNFMAPEETHWPSLGLTLDEKDDFKLIKKIIEQIYYQRKNYNFSCFDIVQFLREHKKYLKINSHVKRNTYKPI